jgi:hypothetical protein
MRCVHGQCIPDHTFTLSPLHLLLLLGMCLLGVGFLLSYQISTIYYKRLMCHSLPPKELIVSCFLAVAPMSMTAWALLNHAAAAQARLPALQAAAARGGDAAASKLLVLAAALLLWGFAVWWLVQAVACVASCVRQGIPFNLGWWGSVFPVGVFTGEGGEGAGVSPQEGGGSGHLASGLKPGARLRTTIHLVCLPACVSLLCLLKTQANSGQHPVLCQPNLHCQHQLIILS